MNKRAVAACFGSYRRIVFDGSRLCTERCSARIEEGRATTRLLSGVNSW
jgi:hypothetical protein